MITIDLEPTISQQLRQALAELAMISHAPTPDYDFSPSEAASRSRWRTSDRRPPVAYAGPHAAHDGGTRIPRGVDGEHRPRAPKSGIPDEESSDKVRNAWAAYQVELEDWRACYMRRTPEFYQREIDRAQSDWRRKRIIEEIKADTQSWLRAPMPIDEPLSLADPQWKRWIAASKLNNGDLARKYNVTRQYISLVRRAYAREHGDASSVD